MNKYRKKPVVIEAVQWTGENLIEVEMFVGQKLQSYWSEGDNPVAELHIKTLEDGVAAQVRHMATANDFIIKGVQGEFYPCKPDIFHLTYESAE